MSPRGQLIDGLNRLMLAWMSTYPRRSSASSRPRISFIDFVSRGSQEQDRSYEEMSKFQSLLEEYEQLVENHKGKSLDITTNNPPVFGQDLSNHPHKRHRYDFEANEDSQKEHGNKWQISEMESYFQEIATPNKIQRRLLKERTNLSTFEIQLWFQNRRSQPTLKEHLFLQSQVEKLQVEICEIKQTICHILDVGGSQEKSKICSIIPYH